VQPELPPAVEVDRMVNVHGGLPTQHAGMTQQAPGWAWSDSLLRAHAGGSDASPREPRLVIEGDLHRVRLRRSRV
jgi:hypothetical protein